MSQGSFIPTSSMLPTSTMVPTQGMGGMVPVDAKMPQQQSSLMGMPPVPGALNPHGGKGHGLSFRLKTHRA